MLVNLDFDREEDDVGWRREEEEAAEQKAADLQRETN